MIVLEISTIATEVMIGYLQYQMEQLVASIVVYFGIVDNSSLESWELYFLGLKEGKVS